MTLPEHGALPADDILTLREVAGLLKVADKTVYTMARQGEIPAFKVRGAVAVPSAGHRRVDRPAAEHGSRGGIEVSGRSGPA